MDIPNALRLALSEELANVPQKSLADAVTNLSQRYRTSPALAAGQLPHEGIFLRSKTDIVAYAAYRMPATFAAVYAALSQIRQRRPDWQPRTLLDVGAGTGSAMWAALEFWPELVQITLFEREEQMIALGKQLATQAPSRALRQAAWQKVDLTGAWESVPHELVIASYVLGELSPAKREEFISKLWAGTADTLVLVEPGTPPGFARIRQARQQLIATDTEATTIAPCPHDLPCPMTANDWCHFAQRITRTPLHRTVKGATLSYEDEKFSYVAMSRSKLPATSEGRIIRHPQIRSGHIYLELCTPQGLTTEIVTRKNKEAFRRARDARWGEPFSR